ncbi:MAG TPA: tyrosine-type recombinase/integrase, partial [Propionibacteriaceae bacterium]|nr:tyrosine-type recombinase/integrase [Propionibacteriaceae bacterium]
AEAGPEGRVFVGPYGVTPVRGNFARIWTRAKKAVGDVVPSDLHFHDLRHAGNHFAASSGASTRELMGRLGHASMRAALIYQHRTMTRDRAIAEGSGRSNRTGPVMTFGHVLGTECCRGSMFDYQQYNDLCPD